VNTRPVPRFFWLLVVTLLSAAFLRLWQLDTLPPGLHYDEAADTIIAQQIARGESAPIFVAAYTGKEVLFFYWAAAWMNLIGRPVFAMRLAAAMLASSPWPITYWTVRELFASCLPPPASGTRSKMQEAGCNFVAGLAMSLHCHLLLACADEPPRLSLDQASRLIQALALAALFVD